MKRQCCAGLNLSLSASVACFILTASLLNACASSTAAKQPPSASSIRDANAQRDLPSLIFAPRARAATALADARLATRNDDRLGADRQPFIRVSESNRYWAYDQYWIVNGRTFQNFQVTTSAREHLVR